MNVHVSKSKNAESFYIAQSYVKPNGTVTSKNIRKLGTLKELSEKLNTDRDGVMAWAKEQARIETEKYKKDSEAKTVLIPFHADRQLDYDVQKQFRGGYLFLQYLYYELRLDKTCRKLRRHRNYEYDMNAILSDLIFTRILEPTSKRSTFDVAKGFLEPPPMNCMTYTEL